MSRWWTLARPPDLLARRNLSFAFDRDGTGVAGVGVADRVVLPPGTDPIGRAAGAAAELLARVPRDRSGPAPLMAGALPFDGTSAGALVLPRMTVRADHAGSWALVTAARDPRWPESLDARRCSGSDEANYEACVSTALDRIASGELEKVVLARQLMVRDASPFDVREVARRLRAADPRAAAFVAELGPRRWLVGASPELLVSRRGRLVRATPLAGSARRHPDPDVDEASARALHASDKDRREHEPVARAVIDALTPFCERIDFNREPHLVSTATMWHLGTDVRAVLREPPPSVLEVAAALHPTPAVCGVPAGRALEVIRELEGFERGGYTGIVGWADANGDGEWTVALRCAEIEGSTATLFAGAGIVAGSDPAAELAETEAKLETMRRALGIAG